MNAAAVRKAFEEGVARMEQALAAGRRIALAGFDGRGCSFGYARGEGGSHPGDKAGIDISENGPLGERRQ